VIVAGGTVAFAFSLFLALVEEPLTGYVNYLSCISFPIGMIVFPAIGLWLYYRKRRQNSDDVLQRTNMAVGVIG